MSDSPRTIHSQSKEGSSHLLADLPQEKGAASPSDAAVTGVEAREDTREQGRLAAAALALAAPTGSRESSLLRNHSPALPSETGEEIPPPGGESPSLIFDLSAYSEASAAFHRISLVRNRGGYSQDTIMVPAGEVGEEVFDAAHLAELFTHYQNLYGPHDAEQTIGMRPLPEHADILRLYADTVREQNAASPDLASRLEAYRVLGQVYAELYARSGELRARQGLESVLSAWLEDLQNFPLSDAGKLEELSAVIRLAGAARLESFIQNTANEAVQRQGCRWLAPQTEEEEPRAAIQRHSMAYELFALAVEQLDWTFHALAEDSAAQLFRDARTLESSAANGSPTTRLQALGEAAALYRRLRGEEEPPSSEEEPSVRSAAHARYLAVLEQILSLCRDEAPSHASAPVEEALSPALRLQAQLQIAGEFEAIGRDDRAAAIRDEMGVAAGQCLRRGRQRRRSVLTRMENLQEAYLTFRALGHEADAAAAQTAIRALLNATLGEAGSVANRELARQYRGFALEGYLLIGDLDRAERLMAEIQNSFEASNRAAAPPPEAPDSDPVLNQAQWLLRLMGYAQQIAFTRAESSETEADFTQFRGLLGDLQVLGERQERRTMELYARFMAALLDNSPEAERLYTQLQAWRPALPEWEDFPTPPDGEVFTGAQETFIPDFLNLGPAPEYQPDPFQAMAQRLWETQRLPFIAQHAAPTLQLLYTIIEESFQHRIAEAVNEEVPELVASTRVLRDLMRQSLSHIQTLLSQGRASTTREAIQMLPEATGSANASEFFLLQLGRAFDDEHYVGRSSIIDQLLEFEEMGSSRFRAERMLGLARSLILHDSVRQRSSGLIDALLRASHADAESSELRPEMESVLRLRFPAADSHRLWDLYDELVGNDTVQQRVESSRNVTPYLQGFNQIVDQVFSVEGGIILLASIFTAGIAAELAGAAMLARMGATAFTVVNGVSRLTWGARIALTMTRMGAGFAARTAVELGGTALWRLGTGQRQMSWEELRLRVIVSFFSSIGDEFATRLTQMIFPRLFSRVLGMGPRGTHLATEVVEFFADGLGELGGEIVGNRVAGAPADDRPFLVQYFQECVHGAFFMGGNRAGRPLAQSIIQNAHTARLTPTIEAIVARMLPADLTEQGREAMAEQFRTRFLALALEHNLTEHQVETYFNVEQMARLRAVAEQMGYAEGSREHARAVDLLLRRRARGEELERLEASRGLRQLIRRAGRRSGYEATSLGWDYFEEHFLRYAMERGLSSREIRQMLRQGEFRLTEQGIAYETGVRPAPTPPPHERSQDPSLRPAVQTLIESFQAHRSRFPERDDTPLGTESYLDLLQRAADLLRPPPGQAPLTLAEIDALEAAFDNGLHGRDAVYGHEPVRHPGVYQAVSHEQVQALSQFIRALGARRVVEVGAGDGRLAAALRGELSDDGIAVRATDDHSWELSENALVENEDAWSAAREADVILVSWPPKERGAAGREAFDLEIARLVESHPHQTFILLMAPPDTGSQDFYGQVLGEAHPQFADLIARPRDIPKRSVEVRVEEPPILNLVRGEDGQHYALSRSRRKVGGRAESGYTLVLRSPQAPSLPALAPLHLDSHAPPREYRVTEFETHHAVAAGDDLHSQDKPSLLSSEELHPVRVRVRREGARSREPFLLFHGVYFDSSHPRIQVRRVLRVMSSGGHVTWEMATLSGEGPTLSVTAPEAQAPALRSGDVVTLIPEERENGGPSGPTGLLAVGAGLATLLSAPAAQASVGFVEAAASGAPGWFAGAAALLGLGLLAGSFSSKGFSRNGPYRGLSEEQAQLLARQEEMRTCLQTLREGSVEEARRVLPTLPERLSQLPEANRLEPVQAVLELLERRDSALSREIPRLLHEGGLLELLQASSIEELGLQLIAKLGRREPRDYSLPFSETLMAIWTHSNPQGRERLDRTLRARSGMDVTELHAQADRIRRAEDLIRPLAQGGISERIRRIGEMTSLIQGMRYPENQREFAAVLRALTTHFDLSLVYAAMRALRDLAALPGNQTGPLDSDNLFAGPETPRGSDSRRDGNSQGFQDESSPSEEATIAVRMEADPALNRRPRGGALVPGHLPRSLHPAIQHFRVQRIFHSGGRELAELAPLSEGASTVRVSLVRSNEGRLRVGQEVSFLPALEGGSGVSETATDDPSLGPLQDLEASQLPLQDRLAAEDASHRGMSGAFLAFPDTARAAVDATAAADTAGLLSLGGALVVGGVFSWAARRIRRAASRGDAAEEGNSGAAEGAATAEGEGPYRSLPAGRVEEAERWMGIFENARLPREERLQALQSLVELGDPEIDNALSWRMALELFGNADRSFASGFALEILDMLDARAVPALLPYLHDLSPARQRTAASLLERLYTRGRERFQAGDALLHWLEGSSSRRMQRSLQRLSQGAILLMSNLVPLSAHCLRHLELFPGVDSLLEQEIEIAFLLGQHGDPRALPYVISATRHPQARVRVRAVSMLRRLGGSRAVPALVERLQDHDGDVLVAALQALAEVGDSRAVEPLLRMLNRASLPGFLPPPQLAPAVHFTDDDFDAQLRSLAALALGRIGDRRARAALEQRLDLANGEPHPGVRRSIREALRIMEERDASTSPVRARVAEDLADPTSHERGEDASPHEEEVEVDPDPRRRRDRGPGGAVIALLATTAGAATLFGAEVAHAAYQVSEAAASGSSVWMTGAAAVLGLGVLATAFSGNRGSGKPVPEGMSFPLTLSQYALHEDDPAPERLRIEADPERPGRFTSVGYGFLLSRNQQGRIRGRDMRSASRLTLFDPGSGLAVDSYLPVGFTDMEVFLEDFRFLREHLETMGFDFRRARVNLVYGDGHGEAERFHPGQRLALYLEGLGLEFESIRPAGRSEEALDFDLATGALLRAEEEIFDRVTAPTLPPSRPAPAEGPSFYLFEEWLESAELLAANQPALETFARALGRDWERKRISFPEMIRRLRDYIRTETPSETRPGLFSSLAAALAREELIEYAHAILEQEDLSLRELFPHAEGDWDAEESLARVQLVRALAGNGIFEGEINPIYHLAKIRNSGARYLAWREILTALVVRGQAPRAWDLLQSFERNSRVGTPVEERAALRDLLREILREAEAGPEGGNGGHLISALLAAGAGAATLLGAEVAHAAVGISESGGTPLGLSLGLGLAVLGVFGWGAAALRRATRRLAAALRPDSEAAPEAERPFRVAVPLALLEREAYRGDPVPRWEVRGERLPSDSPEILRLRLREELAFAGHRLPPGTELAFNSEGRLLGLAGLSQDFVFRGQRYPEVTRISFRENGALRFMSLRGLPELAGIAAERIDNLFFHPDGSLAQLEVRRGRILGYPCEGEAQFHPNGRIKALTLGADARIFEIPFRAGHRVFFSEDFQSLHWTPGTAPSSPSLRLGNREFTHPLRLHFNRGGDRIRVVRFENGEVSSEVFHPRTETFHPDSRPSGSEFFTSVLAFGASAATWLEAGSAEAAARLPIAEAAALGPPAWLAGATLLGLGLLGAVYSAPRAPSDFDSLAEMLFQRGRRPNSSEEARLERFLVYFHRATPEEKSRCVAELIGALERAVPEDGGARPLSIYTPFLESLIRQKDPGYARELFAALGRRRPHPEGDLGTALTILQRGLLRNGGIPEIPADLRSLRGGETRHFRTPAWLSRLRQTLESFPETLETDPQPHSLENILPIHYLDAHQSGAGTEALNGVRGNILQRLALQGWQPGMAPDFRQLAAALLDRENRLPILSQAGAEGRRLLLNGHHRVGALLTLVAEGHLPEEILSRLPFHMAREVEPDRLIHRAFARGNLPNPRFALNWQELLGFDETTRQWLEGRAWNQDLVEWIRAVRTGARREV